MDILPEATRSKLRSTTILTSLTQVVIELVQNSLDAGANEIEIGIDAENWTCWVKDNGTGISRVSLEALSLGLEDRRYATSKAYDTNSLDLVTTFGFRGEALASMADLACLELASRTQTSSQTWSIILKGNQCLYNGPAIRWTSNSPGTVVHVRDAFYSLPVRRHSHPHASKTIESIKHELTVLALISPSVTFTMDDVSKDPFRLRMLSIPRTSSTLATFRHVYGRNLTEHVDVLDETSGEIRIQGFISLEGSLSRNHQYLYLNRHVMAHGDLHRVIENTFSRSTFSKDALEGAGEVEVLPTATRRPPRKAQKQSVYVLSITLARWQVDNCLDPAKAMVQVRDHGRLESALISIIQKFLLRNGFVTTSSSRLRPAGSPSPRKKQRRELPATNDSSSSLAGPLKISTTQAVPADLYIQPSLDATEDEVIWTDPNTNESFIVDMATGNSYPMDRSRAVRAQGSQSSKAHYPPVAKRRTISAPSYRLSAEGATADHSTPDWIQRALQENTVYTTTQRPIRQERLDRPAAGSSSGWPPTHSEAHAFQSITLSQLDPTRDLGSDALRDARVINQVDDKFIACVLTCNPSNMEALPRSQTSGQGQGKKLVLIDQHAADERVRVEQLLMGPCRDFLEGHSSSIRYLDPPKPILLAAKEAERLRASEEIQEALARWGFTFHSLDEETPLDEYQDHTQMLVQTIPSVIADKLLSGDELRDLVKSYMAQADELGTSFALPPMSLSQANGEFVWQKALRWCPKALLDLINSRACRGAIMFNDPLTLAQCEDLVASLAHTALPFQCAHGRPSVVPISHLHSRPRRVGPSAIDWSQVHTLLESSNNITVEHDSS